MNTSVSAAKALSHPLRMEALAIIVAVGYCDEKKYRSISPNEIAKITGAPLTHVSYHVRKLDSLNLIELARKRPKRGVVEHYYRARPVAPKVLDALDVLEALDA